MTDPADGDNRELEAIQRQLADTRQHIAELEALIGELPEIYERKFEQQLQPLLDQERLLLQQNLLLRDQLLRALPGHGAQLLLPPSPAQAAGSPSPVPVQGQAAKPQPPAANPTPGPAPKPEPNPDSDSDPDPDPDQGASAQPATLIAQGPHTPPAEPQPVQPPSSRAAAPGSAPVTPPRAPEPPRAPTGQQQGQGATGATPAAPRQQPRYRLALLATVVALGAFGLAQRPWGANHRQRASAPLGSPKAPAGQAPSPAGQASSSQTASSQPPMAATPAELLVITRGPSWIELRDPSGKTLYAALLEGQKRFRLGAGLSLKAGRPELVRVQLGSAPAQALPPGEWWTWHRFQPPGA